MATTIGLTVKSAIILAEVVENTTATLETMQDLMKFGEYHGVPIVRTTIEGVPIDIHTCSTPEACMATFALHAEELKNPPSAYPYGRDED